MLLFWFSLSWFLFLCLQAQLDCPVKYLVVFPRFCSLLSPRFLQRENWVAMTRGTKEAAQNPNRLKQNTQLLVKYSSEEVKPSAQLFESPVYVMTFAWALTLACPSWQHWTYWSVEILHFLCQEKSFSEGTISANIKLFHQNKINEFRVFHWVIRGLGLGFLSFPRSPHMPEYSLFLRSFASHYFVLLPFPWKRVKAKPQLSVPLPDVYWSPSILWYEYMQTPPSREPSSLSLSLSLIRRYLEVGVLELATKVLIKIKHLRQKIRFMCAPYPNSISGAWNGYSFTS